MPLCTTTPLERPPHVMYSPFAPSGPAVPAGHPEPVGFAVSGPMVATAEPSKEKLLPETPAPAGLSKQKMAVPLFLLASPLGVMIRDRGPKKRKDAPWANAATASRSTISVPAAAIVHISVFFFMFIRSPLL